MEPGRDWSDGCDGVAPTTMAITERRSGVNISGVHVEIPTKTVTASFDPTQATRSQIEATLDEEGYPVAK
jgi:copper chaperone CopZ